MRFEAIIFDFDGVLLESEFEGNRLLAELLTDLGHATTTQEAVESFIGLSGQSFLDAIEVRIGCRLPAEFHDRRKAQSIQALKEGVRAVAGAVEFVRSLPPGLPRAVASSSSTGWLRGHLEHMGLADAFGPHFYSGREHVERGKPAPDLYLHAAEQLAVDIRCTAVIEDSEIGVRGALASGATVMGVAAGAHCFDGHADRLRRHGAHHVAQSFGEVRSLIGLR